MRTASGSVDGAATRAVEAANRVVQAAQRRGGCAGLLCRSQTAQTPRRVGRPAWLAPPALPTRPLEVGSALRRHSDWRHFYCLLIRPSPWPLIITTSHGSPSSPPSSSSASTAYQFSISDLFSAARSAPTKCRSIYALSHRQSRAASCCSSCSSASAARSRRACSSAARRTRFRRPPPPASLRSRRSPTSSMRRSASARCGARPGSPACGRGGRAARPARDPRARHHLRPRLAPRHRGWAVGRRQRAATPSITYSAHTLLQAALVHTGLALLLVTVPRRAPPRPAARQQTEQPAALATRDCLFHPPDTPPQPAAWQQWAGQVARARRKSAAGQPLAARACCLRRLAPAGEPPPRGHRRRNSGERSDPAAERSPLLHRSGLTTVIHTVSASLTHLDQEDIRAFAEECFELGAWAASSPGNSESLSSQVRSQTMVCHSWPSRFRPDAPQPSPRCATSPQRAMQLIAATLWVWLLCAATIQLLSHMADSLRAPPPPPPPPPPPAASWLWWWWPMGWRVSWRRRHLRRLLLV